MASARPPLKGEDDDDEGSRTQLQSPRRATIISVSTTSRKSAPFTKRNCWLLILGLLVIGPIFVSFSIGNGQHANEIVSTMIHSRLQDFEIKRVSVEESVGKVKHQHIPIIESTYDERTVFESIIKRVKWTKAQCNNTLVSERNSLKKFQAATDLPMLQEGGVADALERWLEENPLSSSTNHNASSTCYLPPPKSCHTTTYTLIIMSHTTERLTVFMDPLKSMIDTWPGLTEVIIVWNSPREILTNAIIKNDDKNDKEGKFATQLLQWDQDPSHPLRIFFSLEKGLTNNLLNRYHPKLEPINDAVMYFDDDGPFWSKEAMVYGGLELWKRNSDVQVGGFPRNVRYLSDRMKEMQKTNLQASIDIITRDKYDYVDEIHPTFTPICRNVTGDHVEYNYFSFPDFAGHILLPSGTYIHRNYLCFIWHPAFDELREWVISHKTMPDDMTVSTLVSHLSGKAPRTFPREVKDATRRRLLSSESSISIPSHDDDSIDNEFIMQLHPPDASHRRLLWKQKGWGNMRLEAINSIVGYFGSIHPGTVGWCGGTPYMKHNDRGVPFVCHPEAPTLDLIPWLTEGGVGSNQCPFEANIKMSPEKRKLVPVLKFDDFCGDCKIIKLGNTCQSRMEYLIQKYSLAPEEAKDAVLKEDVSCKKLEKGDDPMIT
jgi:hypothetical protein